MAIFDELEPGKIVSGLDTRAAVTVIAVDRLDHDCLEISWKDSNGNLDSKLLYRHEADNLRLEAASLPWSFDADGAQLRLATEAMRIHYAHLFDPYLAVHTSGIEPLPHQISAVYQEMLGKLCLRYVLADDPGAGKTIMAGLLIKELMIRGDLKRCLIVSPGSLSEQWQDELYRKFNLRFEIMTNDRLESAASGNAFNEINLVIARLDKLARNEDIQNKLSATEWDLIVCDEAHKMSATVWGGEIKMTKRFQLGRLLSRLTRHFLLLTATPHNGKNEDFQLFLSLIDQDRFAGAGRTDASQIRTDDIMRRLVKEDLRKFDGSPLFPERQATTVNYDLSPQEKELYEAVTAYVQSEFNRADNLNKERRNTVGFALTVLQRRLASSPEAIYQSLHRRRERLEERLRLEKSGQRAGIWQYGQVLEDWDEDDFAAGEQEEAEEQIADRASAASSIAELEAEIKILRNLENMAARVRASGRDRKWDELSCLLQDEKCMKGQDGLREKLIIFTEHRDTLRYLSHKIRSLLGSGEMVVNLHGGMARDERHRVEERFKQDKDAVILIATDAAGEGLNLQRAHIMVNYDLPWNPNRLEQRFGRIHRIGQSKTCLMFNLVAAQTREGQVFNRLFEKLEQERGALGGKVFDILGKVTFNNRPLRELLIQAIRQGNDSSSRAELTQAIDLACDHETILNLIKEHALTADIMDAQLVGEIREQMERMEARRLQPHFIEAFFREAFKQLGGKMHPREKGRFEISYVPAALRDRSMPLSNNDPVLQKYERVCFDRAFCEIPGAVPAALICPGHPLLDAVIDLLLKRSNAILKRGTVLIDDNDPGSNARLLFFICQEIQDGLIRSDGKRRVCSQRLHFVERDATGKTSDAGYAPYLDYRPASAEEQQAVLAWAKSQSWLCHGVEKLAISHAAGKLIPAHLQEVRERRLGLIDKTTQAVKSRLTAEIQYWDYRATELKEAENAGKRNANLNSQQARRRADELEERMQKRLADLEAERNISPSPPRVIGGSLIIPAGLLARLTGKPAEIVDAAARKEIELAAMRAVMRAERELGYEPQDVSSQKCGYDIESRVPDGAGGHRLRFIEVKGRVADSSTITVSRNEILTALNQPEQFFLAIVRVDGAKTHTIYLKKPFVNPPDFSTESVTYNLANLLDRAEKVLEQFEK